MPMTPWTAAAALAGALMLPFAAVAMMTATAAAPPPAAAAPTGAPYAGTAQGSLTVDGKAIPLRYAYVVDVDNVEEVGYQPDGPRKYQVLVLSDRPLPAASVADRNAPYSDRHSPGQALAPLTRSDADGMYGILLKLDPAKDAPFVAQFFYPGGDNALSFSVQGTEYPDRVTGRKQDSGGWLTGTALLPAPIATGREHGPKKYQYRATFRAPVQSEPAVTGQWEGKEALAAPPMDAVRAYLNAAKKGDIPALRRLTAASHQGYLDKPEVVQFLKSADTAAMATQIKRVVVRGDRATVLIVNTTPTVSQAEMQLVRENGEWKLYWP